MSPTLVRIATRGSRLALAQAQTVLSALSHQHPDQTFELRVISTRGDRLRDRPLPEIGGKGLFTLDLEQALRRGEVRMAVHSCKDLPVEMPDGFRIGCLLAREDPRDVLISREGKKLLELDAGSVVGTSSPRRRAQLLRLRPELDVVELRGNIETRIRKVHDGECDAAILALAGLRRLGLEEEVTEVLDVDRFIPPAGQGAIAVEVREADGDILQLLSPMDDPSTRSEVEAEMACLAALGGGCRTPIGTVASLKGEEIVVRAGVFSLDGRTDIRTEAIGPASKAASVGKEAADDLLRKGAGEVLGGGEG